MENLMFTNDLEVSAVHLQFHISTIIWSYSATLLLCEHCANTCRSDARQAMKTTWREEVLGINQQDFEENKDIQWSPYLPIVFSIAFSVWLNKNDAWILFEIRIEHNTEHTNPLFKLPSPKTLTPCHKYRLLILFHIFLKSYVTCLKHCPLKQPTMHQKEVYEVICGMLIFQFAIFKKFFLNIII